MNGGAAGAKPGPGGQTQGLGGPSYCKERQRWSISILTMLSSGLTAGPGWGRVSVPGPWNLMPCSVTSPSMTSDVTLSFGRRCWNSQKCCPLKAIWGVKWDCYSLREMSYDKHVRNFHSWGEERTERSHQQWPAEWCHLVMLIGA